MKYKKTILILAAIVIITAWIYFDMKNIEVTRTELHFPELADNISQLKIVHLSDLHGKSFGEGNDEIVEAINKEKPDIIICSGDMINSHDDDGSAFVNLLQSLEGKYPVFYAYGNHDQYSRLNTSRIFESYIQNLIESGCYILDDDKIAIEKDELPITIYGLSSIPYNKKVNKTFLNKEAFNADFISEKIGKPSNNLNILIAHDPSWLDIYSQWGADLVLSGHIHGGAVRLPFLGGVVSPNRELFPKYDAGLFEKGNTFLYVSRGLGTSVERIRVFNRPEIAVIIISTEN
ncbi:MAG: metallophosphoesterase [Clostridiales bacterium]|nr:metallophosphoesterase [Clostridiales bacterium]